MPATMFNDSAKGVSLQGYNFAVERRPLGGGQYERVEHIFALTKTGCVIDLQPQKGTATRIGSSKYANCYPSVIYAWQDNLFVIQLGNEANSTVLIYDPVTRTTTQAFDNLNYLPYYNNKLALANNRVGAFSPGNISFDGKIYIEGDRNRAIPAMARYDGGSWDVFNQNPDIQGEVMQGRSLTTGYIYSSATVAALQGVYAHYLYANDFTPLFSTIMSEAATAGVTFAGAFGFVLHTADRAVVSATRRIFGACNISGVDAPGVYVQRGVDLKTIANRTAGNGQNETTDLVWIAGWGTTDVMSNLTATTGIPNPTYSFSNVYSIGWQVGRFYYISGYFETGQRFYGFPYALADDGGLGIVKGQMIFPLNQTWDRSQSLPNNAGSWIGAYKCNFGGLFGFSSSNEYCMFFYSHADGTTPGFLRPDNKQFQAYNPTTNPSGYVLSALNTFAQQLAEFNCALDGFGNGTENVGGQTAYVSTILTSAIIEGLVASNDANGGNTATVTLEFSPLKSTGFVTSASVDNVPISTADIAGVIELNANQIFVGGLLYAGIFGYTVSGATLSQFANYTNINSIYHTLRYDATTALFLGYTNKLCVVTNAPSFTAYTFASIKQVLYACKHNSYAIVSGYQVRGKQYHRGYCFVATFVTTTGVNALLPNTPNPINPNSGDAFRQALGLLEDIYSDAAVNTAVINYMGTSGKSRAQVIADAVNTCVYAAFEPVNWSTKCLVGLKRRQIAGLRNIRINSLPDGSGTWSDENAGLSTAWPACFYFDKANPTTLVSGDYKTIEFQVPGFQGTDTLGRVAVSTDYVCFLKNENASGVATVRIVQKTAIDAAALAGTPITTFFATVNISLGSTSNAYGFGSGNQGYDFLSTSYKPNNCFFTIGNKLYVSVITVVTSGASKPAIYEVDLAAGTSRIYARLLDDVNKTLNYNPTTDTCFVSVGTVFYRIGSFSGISVPYDIA